MANENLKRVLSVVVEAGNVIPEVASASGLVGRVRALGAMTDELFELTSLDIGELKKEIYDFDQGDKEEVKKFMKDKFDLEDDKLEALIEEGFDLAVVQVELGAEMVAYAKKIIAGKKE
jgi:hypothetical protein